jgi:hypothetical protein
MTCLARRLVGLANVALLVLVVAGCSGGSGSSSATRSTVVVTTWPAPAASPDIVAAQSKIGTVGQTVLTWSTPTSIVATSVDYVQAYVPGAGYSVPAGERAIEMDVRIENGNDTALTITGWDIYADIDNKPLAIVKDASYQPLSTMPAVAPRSSAYIRARALIPTAGGTVVIGISNPDFPKQLATFAVELT